MKVVDYIIEFLLRGKYPRKMVYYGLLHDAPNNCRVIVIKSAFWEHLNDTNGMRKYYMESFAECEGICILNNKRKTPVIFGDSKVEKVDDKIVCHADLVASALFIMSRYEELLFPNRRDEHGRFLSKHSEIDKHGFTERPLVDEYSEFLLELLDDDNTTREYGFNKIYLTHDIDVPFKYSNLFSIFKQLIKNIVPGKEKEGKIFSRYINWKQDPFYTFPEMIRLDNMLKAKKKQGMVEVIYFIIVSRGSIKYNYCNVFSKKFRRLLEELLESGASLGLHIGHAGGDSPATIRNEVKNYKIYTHNSKIISRHHFLKWKEPEDIVYMKEAEIAEDFTLGYPDKIGFRVGTCRSYNFINPKSLELSGIIVHPLEIMEVTLYEKKYMGLSYEDALQCVKRIIYTVHEHNGELNILFHNNFFSSKRFCVKELYTEIIEYIGEIK